MYILDPNSFFNRHVSSDKNANILVGLVLSSLYSQLSKGTSEQNWEEKQKDTQDQPTLLQHWRLVLHSLLSVFKLSQLGILYVSLEEPTAVQCAPVEYVSTPRAAEEWAGDTVSSRQHHEQSLSSTEDCQSLPYCPLHFLPSPCSTSSPCPTPTSLLWEHSSPMGAAGELRMGTDLGFSSDPAPSEVPLKRPTDTHHGLSWALFTPGQRCRDVHSRWPWKWAVAALLVPLTRLMFSLFLSFQLTKLRCVPFCRGIVGSGVVREEC